MAQATGVASKAYCYTIYTLTFCLLHGAQWLH